MAALGQSRRFERGPLASGLTAGTDIVGPMWLVRFVSISEVAQPSGQTQKPPEGGSHFKYDGHGSGEAKCRSVLFSATGHEANASKPRVIIAQVQSAGTSPNFGPRCHR
jgi:hypothetical protein